MQQGQAGESAALSSFAGHESDAPAAVAGNLSMLPGRQCPFCQVSFDTFERAERHIANHLIRIALFTMPRSTDTDPDDDGQDTDSKRNASHLAN